MADTPLWRRLDAGAWLDPTRTYRYGLYRRWGPALEHAEAHQTCQCTSPFPPMVFVMLNPSTADELADDPTIGRCRRFADREGHSWMLVVNLFALRSSSPKRIAVALTTGRLDPIGPLNDAALKDAFAAAGARVVAAWGADPHHRYPARVRHVLGQARLAGVDLWCLGTSKAGAPRHPLYVRGDAPLVRWTEPVALAMNARGT